MANLPNTARSGNPSERTIRTWSSPTVSSTVARTIRVITPSGYDAITSAGSTRCAAALRSTTQLPVTSESTTTIRVYCVSGCV